MVVIRAGVTPIFLAITPIFLFSSRIIFITFISRISFHHLHQQNRFSSLLSVRSIAQLLISPQARVESAQIPATASGNCADPRVETALVPATAGGLINHMEPLDLPSPFFAPFLPFPLSLVEWRRSHVQPRESAFAARLCRAALLRQASLPAPKKTIRGAGAP